MFFVISTYGATVTNAVSIDLFLRVENGNFDYTRSVSGFQVNQVGTSSDLHVQEIGTNTHELITIVSDVSTNGYSFFRNITTNANRYIDVGVQDTNSTFIPFMRLLPNEPAILPLHITNSIYAIGNSNTNGGLANLEFWVNER